MNLRANQKIVLAAAVAGVAVIAFLAIGVFGVHTLFIDDTVDEANPFSTEATMAEAESADDGPAADEAASTTTEPEPVAVTTLVSGSFVDGAHPTRGQAVVITDGSSDRFLRFEEFESDNGPDLNVYLRNPADGDDYIDLGDLKGNIGSQNYELDPTVDLDVYSEVDIWCVRFGVSFGTASLST